MDFDQLAQLIPLAVRAVIWLAPVVSNSAELVKYWLTEHQVWWGMGGIVGLIIYWYWSDNHGVE